MLAELSQCCGFLVFLDLYFKLPVRLRSASSLSVCFCLCLRWFPAASTGANGYHLCEER